MSIKGHLWKKKTKQLDFLGQQKPDSRFSFMSFALKNARFIKIALISTIFQFSIFKLCYPFPDFFSDSYSYIYAAYANLSISLWPIGYSKFLAVFHWITHSDTALIAFQYFFLELSALYFFFTILYFYNPGKITVNCLVAFLFFNPLFLYLSNYVNSDPLFAAISLLWITQLLWIIHRPTRYQIFVQAILLFLAFTVRNNAYYYPIIAALAFALSKQQLWIKVAGTFAAFVLIVPFIIYTRNEAFKMTGTHQFSLFTGWQLANNALYMRDRIEVDTTKLPNSDSRDLDRISRQFIKRIPPKLAYREYLNTYVGNYFIRQPESPLKEYEGIHYEITDTYTRIVAWGKSSAVFTQYGKSLIKQHPIPFLRYFILPNIKNYFLPPLEKLEIYNLGLDDVPIVVQEWFDYQTPDVWAASKKLQKNILFIMSPLFLVLNFLFLCAIISFFVGRSYRNISSTFNRALLLNTAFLIANFGFTVFATINVFRYQFFPMILCLASLLLAMEWLDKKHVQMKQVATDPEKKESFQLTETA